MNDLRRAVFEGDLRKIQELVTRDPGCLERAPESARSLFELARDSGNTMALVRLLRLGSHIEFSSQEGEGIIVDYIHAVSESIFSASWHQDIEFALFELSRGGLPESVFHAEVVVDDQLGEDVAFLLAKAGKWALWSESDGGPVVVSEGTFRRSYEAWKRQSLDAGGA